MLESFFPKPKQFFFCAVAWALIGVFSWYFGGKELGQLFGFDFPKNDAPPIIKRYSSSLMPSQRMCALTTYNSTLPRLSITSLRCLKSNFFDSQRE